MNPAAHAEFEPGDWSPSAAARQTARPGAQARQSSPKRLSIEPHWSWVLQPTRIPWQLAGQRMRLPGMSRRLVGLVSKGVANRLIERCCLANGPGPLQTRAGPNRRAPQRHPAFTRQPGQPTGRAVTSTRPKRCRGSPPQRRSSIRAGSPPTSAGRRRYQGGHANVAHSGPARHRDA
jgi:hypothetical protein